MLPTAEMNQTNDVLKELGYDIQGLTMEEIEKRKKMIENNVHLIRSEQQRINYQIRETEARVNENNEKINQHKQLPQLVANVVEVELLTFFIILYLYVIRLEFVSVL